MTIMKVIFFGNVLVVLVCFAKSEEQQSLSVDPIPSHRALLGDEYGAELDRTKREAAENVQVSSKKQVKPKRLSKQGVTEMKKKKKGKKEQKKRKGLRRVTKKKGQGKSKNKPKKKMKKTKMKNKRQNSARTEKKPNEGPYGYMHPEEIDVCIHFCCLTLYLLNIEPLKVCSQLFFCKFVVD